MNRVLTIGFAVVLISIAALQVMPMKPVEVRASIDRNKALVGQVIEYKIEITKAKGIEAEPVDITPVKNFSENGLFKDREIIISEIVSYEPGELSVPPAKVRYRQAGETGDGAWKYMSSGGFSVTVESLLAREPRMKKKIKTGGGLVGPKSVVKDDESPDGGPARGARNLSEYAIKDSVGPKEPLTAKDVALKGLVWTASIGGAALAVLVALAFYLTRPKKVTPPDVEARASLLTLGADVNENRIGAKEFYSRIVRIVSAYLIGRFSLEKAEMTRTDILASLEKIPEASGKPRDILVGLLSAAESTRYFDGGADRGEMVRCIEDVRALIDLTKKHDV